MAAVLRSDDSRRDDARRLPVYALHLAVTALGYCVAARIGLLKQIAVESAVVTPLWPATGVALSCVVLLGLRVWPGIVLGDLLLLATMGPLKPVSAVLLAGNTLAPVCAYLMLRRVGFRRELDRLRDGLALVFLGALGGMLISSTVGVLVLLTTGQLPSEEFWPVWTAWWTGDAMGVLVFAPLLLALSRFRMPQWDGFRTAEAAALTVAAVAVTLFATRTSLGMLFLVFPLLIWAALRFQLAGGAPVAALISVSAVISATDRVGPFSEHSLMEGMVVLQALNGSAALTGLLLSAMVTEQRHVREGIEDVCVELAEIVDQLAPGTAPRRWPLTGKGRQQEEH
ncbi:MASE1 domain-containing protein [Streptomyces sp. ODS28]|uniref:MASE1 domain-containing protein n=1 Tax=Streptomyces sp. ODS28 TaxID=3136688 RepID=UPI0031F01269